MKEDGQEVVSRTISADARARFGPSWRVSHNDHKGHKLWESFALVTDSFLNKVYQSIRSCSYRSSER